MSRAQEAAIQQLAALRAAVDRHQRDVLPGGVLECRRNNVDVWSVAPQTLSGDYDLDGPVAKAIVSRVNAAAQPDWFQELILGNSGSGFANELKSATIGPGNILGNSMSAMQASAYAYTQRQTGKALADGAQRVSSGSARTVRINEFMELYNANPGKGRPRLRLRIRGMPMSVVSPVVYPEQVRANLRTGNSSARWSQATREQVRRAGVAAAEGRWQRTMGWGTGRVGTGILTFVPTLALDIYRNIKFDMNATGLSRLAGFDRHAFSVDSARNQSGNAVGWAAGAGSTAAVAMLAARGVGVAAMMAGWPVVLLGLGVGIAAQIVWNTSGMADASANLAK